MYRAVLILGFILFFNKLHASQVLLDSNWDKRHIAKASFVFEGTVVAHRGFHSSKGYEGRYLVKVHKVFKGKIRNAYVYIPEPPVSYDEYIIYDNKREPNITGGYLGVASTELFATQDSTGAIFQNISLRDTPDVGYVFEWVYRRNEICLFNKFSPVVMIGNKKFNVLNSLYTWLVHIPGLDKVSIDTISFFVCVEDWEFNLMDKLVRAQSDDEDSSCIKILKEAHGILDTLFQLDPYAIQESRAHFLFYEPLIVKMVFLNRYQDFNAYQYLSEFYPIVCGTDNGKAIGRYFLTDLALADRVKFQKYLESFSDKKSLNTMLKLADWTRIDLSLRKDFLKHIRKPLRKEIAPVILAKQ
jgi:hypothetical protein